MTKNRMWGAVLALSVASEIYLFAFPGSIRHSTLQTTARSFQSPVVSYDSSSANIYRHTESGAAYASSFHLSLEFYPVSASNYANVFQTAPFNSGLRLEVSKPATLVLVAADNSSLGFTPFIITGRLALRHWHRFTLDVDAARHLLANLDGIDVSNAYDPGLALRVSDIRIGTGLSGTRPFEGRIKNASFAYRGLNTITVVGGAALVAAQVLLLVVAVIAAAYLAVSPEDI